MQAENEVEVNQAKALFDLDELGRGVDGVGWAVLPLPGAFAADHDREGVDADLFDNGLRVGHLEFHQRGVGLDFVGDGRNGVGLDFVGDGRNGVGLDFVGDGRKGVGLDFVGDGPNGRICKGHG